MDQASFSSRRNKLEKALSFMQSSLKLLDDADAPAAIGAHLDLAICRLRDHLAESAGPSDGQLSEYLSAPAAANGGGPGVSA